jgi:hypothetical protein
VIKNVHKAGDGPEPAGPKPKVGKKVGGENFTNQQDVDWAVEVGLYD